MICSSPWLTQPPPGRRHRSARPAPSACAGASPSSRARIEKAEARLRQAEAIEKERERKRDTRRKIVLGGALLRQATEERPEALAVIERALERLPEREKGLFAGWKPSDPGRGGNNGSKGNDGD